MYYPDLTPYDYSDRDRHVALNVGWLDAAHPFRTGRVPEGFAERLRSMKTHPLRRTLGHHLCQFCDLGAALPEEYDDRVFLEIYQAHCDRAKELGALGSAEIRVVAGNGKIYAAPELICHYVIVHNYLPPQEFIDAVMDLKLTPPPPDWID